MISEVSNHVWQSTVFAIMAGLLTLAFRKNRAQVRYWLWFSASLKFLIPFSLLLTLGSYLGRSPAAKSIEAPAVSFTVIQIAEPFPAAPPSAPSTRSHGDWIPIAVVSLWACGFAGIGLIRLRGWLRIRAAVRSSLPMDIPFPIGVRSSPALLEPGVVGLFRPILLCPKGIVQRLTPSQLEAVLAHELCHIERRDNLTAAIHMIVEAVFWFHPLVWWISARLMEERERACDEGVLELGSKPEVYAESILKTCEFCVESPLACVSGVTGADLKKRIVRIMTDGLAHRLSFGRKLLLAAAGIAAVAGPIVFGLMNAPQIGAKSPAVSHWERAAGGKMTFEVASIRLSPSDASTRGTDFLIPFDTPPPNKGGLFSANARLFNYIAFAYKIVDTSQYQPLMAHLPKWAQTDQFDIEARAEGNPTKDQMRLMMQSLLEERFKLTIHLETRQRPVYALVLDKPGKLGPHLQPHPDNVPCSDKQDKPEFSDSGTTPPPYCGMAGWLANGQLHERMLDVTMEEIATYVGGAAGFVGGREHLPILDQTGLSGKFDMNIEFVKDSGGPDIDSDASGPTFSMALKNQLGLKLVKQTGPVPVFVIDHVEKPSEN